MHDGMQVLVKHDVLNYIVYDGDGQRGLQGPAVDGALVKQAGAPGPCQVRGERIGDQAIRPCRFLCKAPYKPECLPVDNICEVRIVLHIS
jgi:hypothetical protein